MGRGTLKMELISNKKARHITFEKRKKCLKKKIYELTTLCGVKACMIIYGPKRDDDHRPIEPEIWPTDPGEINHFINSYRERTYEERKKKSIDLSDYFEDRKKRAELALAKLIRKNEEAKYPTWDDRYDEFSTEQLKEFSGILVDKFEAVKKRIELMKSNKTMAGPAASSSGMMDSLHTQSPPNPSCFMQGGLLRRTSSMQLELLHKQQPDCVSSINPHDHVLHVPIPYPLDQSHQRPPFNPNSMMMMMMNDTDNHGASSSSNAVYVPVLNRPVYYEPTDGTSSSNAVYTPLNMPMPAVYYDPFYGKLDQNMILNNPRPSMCYYGPPMQPMPPYMAYPVMSSASSSHVPPSKRD